MLKVIEKSQKAFEFLTRARWLSIRGKTKEIREFYTKIFHTGRVLYTHVIVFDYQMVSNIH